MSSPGPLIQSIRVADNAGCSHENTLNPIYCSQRSFCKHLGNRVLHAYDVLSWRWLGSRVVNVLDSGAEGPGFKSQSRCCRVTVLGKLFTPSVPLFTKQQNWLVAALLRIAGVTAGLAESNGSLPSGLLFTSPAGWLPRTGISSNCSVIEYGLPLPFYCHGPPKYTTTLDHRV